MKQLKAENDEKYGELYRQIDGNYYFICYHCCEHFLQAQSIIDHIQSVHFPTEVKIEEEIFVDVLPKCDDYFNDYDDEPDNNSVCSNNNAQQESTLTATAAAVEDEIIKTENRSQKIKSIQNIGRKLTCDYCMKELQNKNELKRHMLLIHLTKDQPFMCNMCNQQFKTKNLLNGHKKIVHCKIDDIAVISSNLMCNICIETFPNNRAYHSHIRKKHTKYKCDLCECQYNHKRNLLVHYRQKHLPANERPSYNCTELNCGHSCITNALLQDHVRIHHTNEKPYICKICDARFHTRTYLCQHRSRIHGIGNSVPKPASQSNNNGDKSMEQYQCSTCGQISNYRKCYKKSCYTPGIKSSTNRPLQKRNVTKLPHSCEKCGKLYLRRDKYDKHIKDGYCMKKLECQFCHKLFKNRKSYNSHIIDNHNDTKIRPCRYCDMIFKKHWQRYSHEKKHKIELGLIDDDVNVPQDGGAQV